MDKLKTVPFEHKFNKTDAKAILKGFENNFWILQVVDNGINGFFKGQFLFKLDFILDDLGLIFTNAHLNRDPLVYKGSNDLQDLVDIHWMILRYLLSKTFNKMDFQQRSIPMNPETAHAYALKPGSTWPEVEYKVSEFDVRNKVFTPGNDYYYIITDKVPDPSKFWFSWFDYRMPRSGHWTEIIGRADCWTEKARVEIFAFEGTDWSAS